jgi:FKBP-type peptidyl-prolyl cis-trans isomerase FklB
MQKSYTNKLWITAASFLAVGMMLLTNARAQQTPVASPQQTSATNTAQAPAAKATPAPASTAGAQKASAAKTGQASKPTTPAPLVLKTPKDKASYALGMNVGKGLGANLKQQSVDVNQAILLRGLRDALAGGKTLLTDEEMKAALTQLQVEMRARQQEKLKVAAEGNKKEGAEFLEANKTKEGIVTLPSGLQYKILTEGTGPKPTATDSVTCNYRGTLLNGTEFDSSYKRGQPSTFHLNEVIKGWTEALELMPVGSKWQLFVPSDLGYGDPGRGPQIGPGATLIFEVELISIQAKDKDKPADPSK